MAIAAGPSPWSLAPPRSRRLTRLHDVSDGRCVVGSGVVRVSGGRLGETSFSAYLREVRLRNAAQLLARQPLTVREVSLLVGYRQLAHFAKAFRRRYGVTPARYRDRARRNQSRGNHSRPARGKQ